MDFILKKRFNLVEFFVFAFLGGFFNAVLKDVAKELNVSYHFVFLFVVSVAINILGVYLTVSKKL